MNALLFLAMLAALIAGCCWFVWTLPKQKPTYDAFGGAHGPKATDRRDRS